MLRDCKLEIIEKSEEKIAILWELDNYDNIPTAGTCRKKNSDDILFFATKYAEEKIYVFSLQEESYRELLEYIDDFRDKVGYVNDYGDKYNPCIDMGVGETMRIIKRDSLNTGNLLIDPLFYVNYDGIVNPKKTDMIII